MGMFDKDKVFAPDGQLGNWINADQEFILWDAWIQTEEFEPQGADKPIAMAHLVVSTGDMPEKRETVSTLASPICDKIREKADGDLPAVVKWYTVPAKQKGFSDAVVLQFVAPYEAAAVKS